MWRRIAHSAVILGKSESKAMVELLTAAQMRAIEQAAITSGRMTGRELMERAGQGVVDAVLAEWPDLAEGRRRAVVLCGPGNNGGDGFVVARLLKALGWDVEVFLYGDPSRLPPDARTNYERLTPDIPQVPISADDTREKFAEDLRRFKSADLFVEALLGTGLTRARPQLWAVSGLMHGLFDDGIWADGTLHPPRVVAVDLPSGICADSGRALLAGEDLQDWGRIAAHLTVTFHRAKLGHYLADGPMACGKLTIADIGL